MTDNQVQSLQSNNQSSCILTSHQKEFYQLNERKQYQHKEDQLPWKFKKYIHIYIGFIVVFVILSLYHQKQYFAQKLFISTSSIQHSQQRAQTFMHSYMMKHISQQQVKALKVQQLDQNMYECPKSQGLFHVYLNQNDIYMKNLESFYKIRAKKCQIQIIGLAQLEKMVIKWNSQTQTDTNQTQTNINQTQNNKNLTQTHKIKLYQLGVHQRKMMLIFLQLYYHSGTYVNIKLSLNYIQDRCWNLAVIGFDILFISTKKVLQNGLRVPDFQKFIRVKYPYTPMIKQMINYIIKGKDYHEQCYKRQCLIITCDESPTDISRQQLARSQILQNSKFDYSNKQNQKTNKQKSYRTLEQNFNIKNQQKKLMEPNKTIDKVKIQKIVPAINKEIKQVKNENNQIKQVKIQKGMTDPSKNNKQLKTQKVKQTQLQQVKQVKIKNNKQLNQDKIIPELDLKTERIKNQSNKQIKTQIIKSAAQKKQKEEQPVIQKKFVQNKQVKQKIDEKAVQNKQLNQKIDEKAVQNQQIKQKIDKKAVQNKQVNQEKGFEFIKGASYNIFSGISPFRSMDIVPSQRNQLITYQWSNSSNQLFQFIPQGNRKFKIYNALFNKFMNMDGQQCQNNISILFKQQMNHDRQVWEMIPVQQIYKHHQLSNMNNAFFIKSTCGKTLNLLNSSLDIGTSVVHYTFEKQKNEIWIVELAYRPELQQTDAQSYEKRIVLQLYSHASYLQNYYSHWRLIQYLRLKRMSLGLAPYWLSLQNIQPQSQNLPLFNQQYVQHHSQQLFPSSTFYQCAKNHKIAYIWFGNKQMPQEYKKIIQNCIQNVRLLTEVDLEYYVDKWNHNIKQYNYNIIIQNIPIRLQVNILKLLYLYFESGIYADFDTQINQKCFENVYTDEVIWSNYNYWPDFNMFYVPQQGFISVKHKYHPQIKRMIEQEIYHQVTSIGGTRWIQCKNRQCLIINCQRHFRDKTYTKGFD